MDCPFCGAGELHQSIERITRSPTMQTTIQVYCKACGAHGPYAMSVDDAKAKWQDLVKARVTTEWPQPEPGGWPTEKVNQVPTPPLPVNPVVKEAIKAPPSRSIENWFPTADLRFYMDPARGKILQQRWRQYPEQGNRLEEWRDVEIYEEPRLQGSLDWMNRDWSFR